MGKAFCDSLRMLIGKEDMVSFRDDLRVGNSALKVAYPKLY